MKLLTTEMQEHLAQEVTTLCVCWKLTLKSGQVRAFTSLDHDLEVDGLVYKATSGGSATGAPSSIDGTINSLDWSSFVDDSTITEDEILSGVFDNALVEAFRVNWARPQDGAIWIQVGRIGDIALEGGTFIAEVRGRRQNLKRVLGEVTSPSCRAALGDNRCQVNMAGFAHNGTVTAVNSNRSFVTTALGQPDGYFLRGQVLWTAGANAGLAAEVKTNLAGNVMELMLNASKPIAIGDAFTAHPGCDKSLETCRDVFSNVVNFRGEPFIRGMRDIIAPMGVGS